MIAIDTETESLIDKTLIGFSVAGKGGAEYYPIAHRHPNIKNVNKKSAKIMLQAIVNHNKVVFHNSSFDMVVLKKWGIDLSKTEVDDTLVLANLYDENVRHGLKALSKRYLHHTMTELKEIVGTGKKRISVADADERILDYAEDDARQTLKLFNYLYPRILQDGKLSKLYHEIEKPLLPVVANMHMEGICVDIDKVKKITKLCEKKVESLGEKLEILIGDVNLKSSKQLKVYFIDKMHMPIIKTSGKTKAPSMDKEVLEVYAETNGAAKLILEYRKYSKILGTFIPAFTPTELLLSTKSGKRKGRIYPSFNQAGTTSGRFSSSHPNFQNIPKGKELDFRACVIAKDGYVLVGADYSQIELRVLAHFSHDLELTKAYMEGKDIHRITANACGVDRDTTAKTINFGLVYRMMAKTLSKRIGCSYEEAQKYMDKFFETYNGIKPFWEATEAQIRNNGYVETFMGRKRRTTREFEAKDEFDQSKEIRSLTNAIIQGSAADLMKIAMIPMHYELKKIGANIIAQIHDEVIVECPKKMAKRAYAIVTRTMIAAGEGISVPIEVDAKIGDSWRLIH